MYGMVNQALRAMVLEAGGEAAWQQVRAAAGGAPDRFVNLQPYADETTYALAVAAAELLGRPLDALLVEFGRFWIPFAEEQGYGEVLALAGDSLNTFLANLDDLHTRLSLSFPEFRPPSFSLEEVAPGHLHLHYRSERAGLGPFVVGLVHGVAARFGVRLGIEVLQDRAHGADHDVLSIRTLGPEADH